MNNVRFLMRQRVLSHTDETSVLIREDGKPGVVVLRGCLRAALPADALSLGVTVTPASYVLRARR